MRKRRKFYSGRVNHIYQRTVNWVNIFYSDEDFLVYYTIFSVCAKSADIIILNLCMMFDHVHFLAITENIQELSGFVDRFASWHVHEYNCNIHRRGKLYHKNFGSAPKWNDKDIRSAINYVGNNPVEKKLCNRAEEYRWNFLAYAISKNPFSEEYIANKASKKLRNVIREAKEMAELNLPLKYVHLRRMMKGLSSKERQQFVDQVITIYLPFDYQTLIGYFGSYSLMTEAMNSNTGSEFDINEPKDASSHTIFRDIIEYLGKIIAPIDIGKITTLPEQEKNLLAVELKKRFKIGDWQLRKFLHITK